jgi:nitroreductase
MNKNYLQSLSWRYATKLFNDKKIPTDSLDRILEAARLAPSSFGIEPWKIIHVVDPSIRTRLQEVGYGQEKISQSSDLLVIAARTDGHTLVDELVDRIVKTRGVSPESLTDYKAMMDASVDAHEAAGNQVAWHKSQTYIMLGFLLFAAALEGVDAGPMEGFDTASVNKILDLGSQGMTAVTMVALGYRSDQDPFADYPKVRRAGEDFIEVK